MNTDATSNETLDKNPKKEKNNYISSAWLVILLAVIYGSALAGVHIFLNPIIQENKKNETYSQIPNLIKGAIKENTKEEEFTTENGKTIKAYKAIGKNDNHLGWVLPGKGQGYSGEIELLIGIDKEFDKITGMFVITQTETPGLGDYITDGKKFRNQFANKNARKNLVVVKKTESDIDNEICALTGATISSDSVSSIINKTIAKYKNILKDNK